MLKNIRTNFPFQLLQDWPQINLERFFFQLNSKINFCNIFLPEKLVARNIIFFAIISFIRATEQIAFIYFSKNENETNSNFRI